MTTLRVMSYNVRSLRDDTAALGRVMRQAEPQVMIIQEAPRFLRWRSSCAALARRAGLVVVGGGRACGANLVLSSLAVDVEFVREVAFSRDRGLHHRGVVIALLRTGGVRFAVAGTHLDLVEGPRLRHIAELSAALGQSVPADVARIVGGDLNDVPGSPTWQAMQQFGVDSFAQAGTGTGFTVTSTDPQKRIDALFTDQRVRLERAWVPESPDVLIATDHRPLVIDCELPADG